MVKAPDFDSHSYVRSLPPHQYPRWAGRAVRRLRVSVWRLILGGAMAFERMRIFTGNANPKLAEAVVKHMNISLGRCIVGRFSDGEVMVELLENVRGRDVFILQSTCAPTNDNLMEILVMVDALKRASAGRITAAIPYLGYARQDRRPRSARVAITAKVSPT